MVYICEKCDRPRDREDGFLRSRSRFICWKCFKRLYPPKEKNTTTIEDTLKRIEEKLDHALSLTTEEKKQKFARASGKNYIEAIKFVKMGFDCSLREAKHLVDGIINQNTREVWDNLSLIIRGFEDVQDLRIEISQLKGIIEQLRGDLDDEGNTIYALNQKVAYLEMSLAKKSEWICELKQRSVDLSDALRGPEDDKEDIPF